MIYIKLQHKKNYAFTIVRYGININKRTNNRNLFYIPAIECTFGILL